MVARIFPNRLHITPLITRRVRLALLVVKGGKFVHVVFASDGGNLVPLTSSFGVTIRCV
jgi:hypothetical protein